MIIKDIHNISNYNIIKENDNGREIRLYNFKDVTITGNSYFYPDCLLKSDNTDYLVLPIKEMSMSLKKKSYYEENGMEYDFKSDKKIFLMRYLKYIFLYIILKIITTLYMTHFLIYIAF